MLLQSSILLAQTPVKEASYSELAFTQTRLFPAQVENLKLSTLSSEASGRITKISVEVGERVKKGQTLLRIECETTIIRQRQASAALKRLQAQRQLTLQQLDRAERLLSSKSISREQVDQRQTQLDADNASIDEQQAILETIARNIDDCELKAPFPGQIIARHLSVGDFSNLGTPAFDLLDPQALEVSLQVPVSFIDELETASSIQFLAAGHQYPVKVRSILPWVNPDSHQQVIRLSFHSDKRPAAGMRGQVRYQTSKNFLPAELLQQREGQLGIFINERSMARFIPISHAQQGQAVQLDIPAQTRIIVSPLQLLTDQAPISTRP